MKIETMLRISRRSLAIFFSFNINTYFQYGKKSILTLVTGGGKMLRNYRDSYRHVYIFLIRKKKENLLEKCVYWESKLAKFRPERTKAYEARAE